MSLIWILIMMGKMDNSFYYRGKALVIGNEQSSYFFQTCALKISIKTTSRLN